MEKIIISILVIICSMGIVVFVVKFSKHNPGIAAGVDSASTSIWQKIKAIFANKQ